jgi:hypothetical protein
VIFRALRDSGRCAHGHGNDRDGVTIAPSQKQQNFNNAFLHQYGPDLASIAELESLKPGENIDYAQTVKKYGVSRVTLARRHQGRKSLHPQQKHELVHYIKRLTKRGLPPTRAMIRNFGSQIAG